jgi:hypothetical protein
VAHFASSQKTDVCIGHNRRCLLFASLAMLETTSFQCPQCAAVYQVVRIEADSADDREINCPACHAPLRGRDGNFFLKYFMMGLPKRSPPHGARATSRARA